jgi:protein involved in polysaccharide export with SLBB domain
MHTVVRWGRELDVQSRPDARHLERVSVPRRTSSRFFLDISLHWQYDRLPRILGLQEAALRPDPKEPAMKSLTASTLLLAAALALSAAPAESQKRSRRVPAAKTTRPAAPTAKPAAKPANKWVTLVGPFEKSGSVAWRQRMTAKDAIQAVGGFGGEADAERITLRRAGQETLGTLNGKLALEGDAVQNILLRPGDVLVVERRAAPAPAAQPIPAATADDSPAGPAADAEPVNASPAPETPQPAATEQAGRVAILGAVEKPGLYTYRPTLLKDAVQAVGGLAKNADACKVIVLRGGLNAGAKPTEIKVDLGKVLKGEAQDIALLPDDVVQIPEAGRKRTFWEKLGGGVSHIAKQAGAFAGNAGKGALPVLGLLATGGTSALPSLGALSLAGSAAGQERPEAVPFSGATRAGAEPTPLEAALIKAISEQSPEVRERILSQVRAALQPGR